MAGNSKDLAQIHHDLRAIRSNGGLPGVPDGPIA
jgi:hypothetical protein